LTFIEGEQKKFFSIGGKRWQLSNVRRQVARIPATGDIFSTNATIADVGGAVLTATKASSALGARKAI
jgi:hypothetical protein